MEILALGVLLSGFLLGLVLGAPYIRLLRHFRIGQNIRPEGPQTHYVKQGIPTMGGGLFIGVTFVLWLFVLLLISPEQRDLFIPQTIVPIGTLIFVGMLGAIDDLVNVRYGFGIRGRHKLVWQVTSARSAIYIQRHVGVTGISVPLVGETDRRRVRGPRALRNRRDVEWRQPHDGMAPGRGGDRRLAFLSIALSRRTGFEGSWCSAPRWSARCSRSYGSTFTRPK